MGSSMTPGQAEDLLAQILESVDPTALKVGDKLPLAKVLDAALTAGARKQRMSMSETERERDRQQQVTMVNTRAKAASDKSSEALASRALEAEHSVKLKKEMETFRAAERPALEAQGKISAEEVVRQNQMKIQDEAVQKSNSVMQGILSKINKGEFDKGADYETRLTSLMERELPPDAPNRSQLVARAKETADARRVIEKNTRVANLVEQGVDPDTARAFTLNEQAGATFSLDEAKRASEARNYILTESAKRNVAIISGPSGENPVAKLTKSPRMFQEGALAKVGPDIVSALSLVERGGAGIEAGKVAATSALAKLESSPFWKKLGIGGAGALLLLPLLKNLLGGGGQSGNPMEQARMMEQMAQMQQNQQLAGSLSNSRDASADADRAKADLLRMQAMMLAGGGARGGAGL